MDVTLHKFAWCFIIPLIFVCVLLEKKSRLLIIAMIVGAFQCLVVLSIVNCIMKVDTDIEYVFVTYMPLFVELFKVIPVIFFAIVYIGEFSDIFNVSISLATGFAVMESVSIIDNSNIDILYMVSNIMVCILINIVCSALVGAGIYFIIEKGKIFILGVFGLYIVAATLHGIIYLVQLSKNYLLCIGSVLIIYIPIIIYYYLAKRRERIKNRL